MEQVKCGDGDDPEQDRPNSEGELEPAFEAGVFDVAEAERRLDVLQDTQFLGAGSIIAEKDLEMRGAGNILGREQSGVAARVGLNLYSQFLAEAVERLRANDSHL